MKKGFSFIELVIIISIILLISATSIAYYLNNNQQIKLKTEAKKLIDILSLAKKKAQVSELIPTPGNPPTYCSDFNGYGVELKSNLYNLKYYCNNTDIIINTYKFPSNIFYIGVDYNFNFTPLDLNTDITVNTITLKNNNINQCINIEITSNGIISINESLYSC